MAVASEGTLLTAIDLFLDSKRRDGLQEHSVEVYRSTLSRLGRMYPDSMLSDFEAPAGTGMLRAYLGADSRGAASVRRDHSTVGEFFKWAVQQGRVIASPATAIQAPDRPEPRELREIPPHHVAAILAAAENPRDELVLRIILTVPVKTSELLRVQVRDYNIHSGTLTLHTARGRPIPIQIEDPDLRAALKGWVDERMGFAGVSPPPWATEQAKNDYLFHPTVTHTRPLTISGARKWWKRTLNRAGLANEYSIYDARRTAQLRAASATPPPAPSLAALTRAVGDAPPDYRDYLIEALGCYQFGLYRATILMVWNAVMQHLYGLVDRQMLAVMENENRRRSNGNSKNYRELKEPGDLRYLSEREFIELAETAGLYDRNGRRVLLRHLETRNLCGHPTSYQPGESETTNLVESLLQNILDGGMLTKQVPKTDPPLKERRGAPGERTEKQSGVREAIAERVRHEVWRRDQGRCVECGSRERLEFDHIIPVVENGSNTARNIELRCESCNRKKGARI